MANLKNKYYIALKKLNVEKDAYIPEAGIEFISESDSLEVERALKNILGLISTASSLSGEDLTAKLAFVGENMRLIDLGEPRKGHKWVDGLQEITSTNNRRDMRFKFNQVKIPVIYNWNKTGPDVHVFDNISGYFFPMTLADIFCSNKANLQLAKHWQVHDGSVVCPIDAECCIITIELTDGQRFEKIRATDVPAITWRKVSKWKFEKLIDATWN